MLEVNPGGRGNSGTRVGSTNRSGGNKKGIEAWMEFSRGADGRGPMLSGKEF